MTESHPAVTESHPAIEPRALRNVCGRFATGVTVVTTRTADGTNHGMTANAFSSVSLDPPLILVCVAHKSHAHGHLQESGSFVVNLLCHDQLATSDRFAHRILTDDGYTSWPNDRDKFDDLAFSPCEHTGAAILDGNLGTLSCQVHEVLPGGDHSVFIGRVVAIEGPVEEAAPLLFFGGKYAQLTDT